MINIYFGQMCVGKSTYLKSLGKYIDFDLAIWTQFHHKECELFKEKIMKYILSEDLISYNKILNDMSNEIGWELLFNSYKNISKNFEMSAIGAWWDFIPEFIKTKNNFFKIICTKSQRKRFSIQRGCSDKLKMFDKFYKDPPINYKIIKTWK